jgi:2-oxoglutarate dehydrogenase complex dehydrogenase (E1) component-like enzyme
MLVPILDEIADQAALAGARDVVIGMAHRGRLNVLAHVLEKPYEKILVGFQGAKNPLVPADGTNPDVPSGDVKYHMGWQTVRGSATTRSASRSRRTRATWSSSTRWSSG